MTGQATLLALPRELRDRIYDYIATDEQYVRVKRDCNPEEQQVPADSLAFQSSLLLTCKQLHDEYTDVTAAFVMSVNSTVTLVATIRDKQHDDIQSLVRLLLQLQPAQRVAISKKARLSMRLLPGHTKLWAFLRKDLAPWITACTQYGISASYTFSGPAHHGLGHALNGVVFDITVEPGAEMSKVRIALLEWDARNREHREQKATADLDRVLRAANFPRNSSGRSGVDKQIQNLMGVQGEAETENSQSRRRLEKARWAMGRRT